MTVMVTACDQKEAQRIAMLREKGYTFKQISEITQRHAHQVTRYYRLFERYGHEAFAETSKKSRDDYAREMRNAGKVAQKVRTRNLGRERIGEAAGVVTRRP